LGSRWTWLAVAFSAFGAICAFGIGNMTQINAAVGTFEQMLVDLKVFESGSASGAFTPFKLVMGVVLAVLVGLVIVGGMRRIGETAEFLVPFAGVFCILGSVIAIIIKADQLGYAFSMMIQGAFNMQAAAGGVLGYTIMQAIRFGVARGVFTNEAGLGSAPIAHAAADVDHPVKQGMWGCFEVFADTLIMCSLTGLVIMTSGVYGGVKIINGARVVVSAVDGSVLTATTLVSAAFKASFGVFGSVFLAMAVLVFAYCTTLSWSFYGLRCFQYLFKGKGSKAYMILFSLVVVSAALMQLTLAWDIADTLNGLMAIPNLIALVALSGIVIKLTKDYFGEKQVL
jgi:AGCS family alanine or glycine:cation symporter